MRLLHAAIVNCLCTSRRGGSLLIASEVNCCPLSCAGLLLRRRSSALSMLATASIPASTVVKGPPSSTLGALACILLVARPLLTGHPFVSLHRDTCIISAITWKTVIRKCDIHHRGTSIKQHVRLVILAMFVTASKYIRFFITISITWHNIVCLILHILWCVTFRP